MKKLRITLIITAMIIILAELFLIDYKSLFDAMNLGAFLVMISMVLLIVSLIVSLKQEKRLKE